MRQVKIKNGMKGSNNGKSRTMKTEMLKKVSKRMRRIQDKMACDS